MSLTRSGQFSWCELKSDFMTKNALATDNGYLSRSEINVLRRGDGIGMMFLEINSVFGFFIAAYVVGSSMQIDSSSIKWDFVFLSLIDLDAI